VHVVHMEEMQIYKSFYYKHTKTTDQLDDPSLDGVIILKFVLNKYDVRTWTGFIFFMIGNSGDGL
jgi:hypothetical protein